MHAVCTPSLIFLFFSTSVCFVWVINIKQFQKCCLKNMLPVPNFHADLLALWTNLRNEDSACWPSRPDDLLFFPLGCKLLTLSVCTAPLYEQMARLYIYCQILLRPGHVVSWDSKHMFVPQNSALQRRLIELTPTRANSPSLSLPFQFSASR